MADTNKDTIYVDIDDEITAIIDKVRGSSSKVVALVLPKRATTLQSIVNMKLLKRAGEEAKKNLVLITTESGLMPLAGAVGLHVAKTPSSRPEIPAGPDSPVNQDDKIEELDDFEPEPSTAENAGDKPIGVLAGATAGSAFTKPEADTGIETLELDNAEPVAAAAASTAKKPKVKKDKKLSVPDFDRFRLMLIGGGVLLVLLIIGGYFALAVLPKATINIKTNASTVNTDVDFTLSTTVDELSTSSNIVPAKQVQTQKTLTGTANATGQKNNGERASGTVTMTAGSCSADVPNNVPANFGISSGGKTYITQESTSFQPFVAQGKCTYRSSSPTNIRAQNGGTNFNLGDGSSFSVRSGVTATGSASGGTDDIQTVVSQADIDSAKAKINAEGNGAQEELEKQLEDQDLMPIAATFTANEPTASNSADAGDEANTVTVSQTYTYTMLGADESDIQTLVDNDIKGQIDTELQDILDRGLTQGAIKLTNLVANGASLNVQTVAEVGPSIDTDAIAQDAVGKKSSEIKSSISGNPDVTDVEVKLSPFWVSKAPKAEKITVEVAKPTRSANAN